MNINVKIHQVSVSPSILDYLCDEMSSLLQENQEVYHFKGIVQKKNNHLH